MVALSIKRIERPWNHSSKQILDAYKVKRNKGLDSSEIEARREKFGSNQLEKKEKKSALRIFVEQLKSILVLLLSVAAIISFIFGEFIEGIAISAVIVINTLIGFFTELKASTSMESLI